MMAGLNRVILLSYGLANAGQTNSDAIASDVHGLAQRGVSTSAMGLGDSYNEDLLEAIARSGDGSYYYIDSADALPGIFEEELQGLTLTFGKSVTLAMDASSDVVISEVFNDLQVNEAGHFKLSNLIYGSPLDIVVRLQVPPLLLDDQPQSLCHFTLRWDDPSRQSQTLQAVLKLPVVSPEQLSDFPLNSEVQQQVMLMQAAASKREAVRFADQGCYDQAGQVLQHAKQELLDASMPMSAPEAAAIDDLEQSLSLRDMAKYRKMASHQSYARSSRRSRGHSSLLYAFDRGPKLGDISQQDTVAIINSTDRYLSNSGAISAAIHQAAGPELLKACRQLNECEKGHARITPGFKLKAEWVIHTSCPTWRGGQHQEEALLSKCYLSCLELAACHGIHSIAFPAIGTGALGFTTGRAALVAMETISQFLQTHSSIGTVRLVCFDRENLYTYEKTFRRFLSR